jgi:hypothetical protein
MQFILEMAILECSFVKHSQEILGLITYRSHFVALTLEWPHSYCFKMN